jgi:hypothetical protein
MSQRPKARLALANVDRAFLTKGKLLTQEAKAQAAADSNESEGFAKAMRKSVLSAAAA